MDGLGLASTGPARPSIGLTGGIGSGKSTVASMLVALGARLIDTDAIARSLTLAGGAAMPALAEAFGHDIVDAAGALDRARMRTLAFADRGAKQRLESILHPLIGLEARRQAALAAGAVVVYDVPLLVESSHWRQRVDRVLVVDCPEQIQVERVVRRSGWSEDAVLGVIAQQATRSRRRAVADAVIHNVGLSMDQLRVEVAALWALWTLPGELQPSAPGSQRPL